MQNTVRSAGGVTEDALVIETPSPSALAQAARAIAPGARARCVRRLAGGTHATTHLLHVGPPEQELVLRRFPPGDPAPGYEAGVLAALEGLNGWAPRLVDADPDGSRYGAPAVLITRIPAATPTSRTSRPRRPQPSSAVCWHSFTPRPLHGCPDCATGRAPPWPHQHGPATEVPRRRWWRLTAIGSPSSSGC